MSLPIDTIIHTDALQGLKQLPDKSVHCIVTSPPYWGLRDYGTASWTGGQPDCNHKRDTKNNNPDWEIQTRGKVDGGVGDEIYKSTCGKCGAIRIDKQMGLEKTPEEYIINMVGVFRECNRVLRNDGTLWLNIGDSYNAGRNGGHAGGKHSGFQQVDERYNKRSGPNVQGLKPKDLVGIPWMLAFALRADGWYLRQDIIWHKPNTMPESVTDRCTKSHEYVFLLTKSAKYYYDNEAIKQPLKDSSIARYNQDIENQKGSDRVPGKTNGAMKAIRPHGIVRDRLLDYDSKEKVLRPATKRGGFENENDLPGPVGFANKRSVWTVTPMPFKEAHFATFPQDLIVDMIKAGTSEHGCCEDCGAPYKRIIEPSEEYKKFLGKSYHDHSADDTQGFMQEKREDFKVVNAEYITKGWEKTCKCETDKIAPPIVLDPFMGAGTTALVAKKLHRNFIGMELNADYIKIAEKRLHKELGMFYQKPGISLKNDE